MANIGRLFMRTIGRGILDAEYDAARAVGRHIGASSKGVDASRVFGNIAGTIGGGITGGVIGGAMGGPGGAVIGAVAGATGGASLNTLSRHGTRKGMGFDAWDPNIKQWINGIDAASSSLQREYGRATRKFNEQWTDWGREVTSIAKRLDIDANDVMRMSRKELADNGVSDDILNRLHEGTFAGERAFLLGDVDGNEHIKKVRELSDRIKTLQDNIQSATGRNYTYDKAAASTSLADDNMFLPKDKTMITDMTFESEFTVPVTRRTGTDKTTGNPITTVTDENKKITRHKELSKNISADGTVTYSSRNYDLGRDGEKHYIGDARTISEDKYNELLGKAGNQYDVSTIYKDAPYSSKMTVSTDASGATYIYNGGEGAAYEASNIGLPQQKEGWSVAGRRRQKDDASIVAAQIAQAKTGDSDGIGLIGTIKEHPLIAMGIAAGGAAILANQNAERQGAY